MSQPPGQSPGPYGQPGRPYGQPGPYVPPSQPGQYPQPGPYGYGSPGGPGGYGGPPAPKKNLLPWFIVGGAVLLSGLGILLVVLLTGDDGSSTTAGGQTTASAPATDEGSQDDGALPGGASAVETDSADDSGPSETAYDGSEDVALDFMNAMLNGDNQAAYDLSCDGLQAAGVAFGAAIGGTAADGLAKSFHDTLTNGELMTDGTFDSIEYVPANGVDRAAFTAVLESGSEVEIHVDVDSDLTVCNWY